MGQVGKCDLFDSCSCLNNRVLGRRSYDPFGVPQSVFGTLDHDQHHIRRASLNHYFSHAKVRSLAPRIDAVITKLLDRLSSYSNTEPVIISHAFAALTNGMMRAALFYKSMIANAGHRRCHGLLLWVQL